MFGFLSAKAKELQAGYDVSNSNTYFQYIKGLKGSFSFPYIMRSRSLIKSVCYLKLSFLKLSFSMVAANVRTVLFRHFYVNAVEHLPVAVKQYLCSVETSHAFICVRHEELCCK